jgi:hypothetical protein
MFKGNKGSGLAPPYISKLISRRADGDIELWDEALHACFDIGFNKSETKCHWHCASPRHSH